MIRTGTISRFMMILYMDSSLDHVGLILIEHSSRILCVLLQTERQEKEFMAEKNKNGFRRRESNPGLLRERQKS